MTSVARRDPADKAKIDAIEKKLLANPEMAKLIDELGTSTTDVRLPSFSGHPISTDLVSVGEDVHCEFVKEEVHPGVPA
ncbi:hypothetical protein D9542_08320 [Corynebacterium macginleyi]|nr:hypothetical protein D9542_08320 [Corynebacterium macginleyi]